jgi:hypothetical protein
MSGSFFVKRYAAWSPGISAKNEWFEWSERRREIVSSGELPPLPFLDLMFKRRLSQLSLMTIEVLSRVTNEDRYCVFCSFRGEITTQYKNNKTLIEDRIVKPANFSLSVFNAPVALASIALKLKYGYICVAPVGDNPFLNALIAAKATLCGMDEALFVYADELIPPSYGSLAQKPNAPFAFAALINKNSGAEVDIFKHNSPYDLLRYLLRSKAVYGGE